MTEVPDDKIFCTMAHVRDAALCSRGARRWFMEHGFDWNEFLTDGLRADRVAATGDAFALRVVEIARREAHGRR